MLKLKFFISLCLMLFFSAISTNVFAQIRSPNLTQSRNQIPFQSPFQSQSQNLNQVRTSNQVYSGSMPQFFTAPAIDESQMEYYLAEGVSQDRILHFAWSKAETGYYKGAEFYYSVASQRFPSDYRVQATFATFYYQMGRIPQSITQFQVARNVATNQLDRDAANYFIERIARESRLGKETVDAYYLGVNAFFAGDVVSAAGWLEQSLASTPDWVEAQYWLGRSYYEYGQNFEAIFYLEQVVAALPKTDERALGAAWLVDLMNQ